MSAAMADLLEPAGAGCTSRCEALRGEAAGAVLAEAQRGWAARPVRERLEVVRAARHWLASRAAQCAEAISPALQRSQADTLAAEVLPLLDAMRFLERRAGGLLAPRALGWSGRPLWLTGVRATVQRVPLGHVLVIGPGNFPLFLPGVQALQALVAGNAVTWKPGAGGEQVANMVAQALREGGLPGGVLSVTGESVEAAERALAAGPDKVVFTGSLDTGRRVLRALAKTATPAVMELSGADAVVVLPSADLALAAKAIAFGLRLNGAAVCMSPRRLVATAETLRALRPILEAELGKIPPVRLKQTTAERLEDMLARAERSGAAVLGAVNPASQRPLLVERARPEMEVARSDVFAPVLSILEAPSVLHMPELVNACPFGLTAAIFGAEREARAVGEQLRVGTVLVNDVIAPTADPRVPFGGRGESGFGVTRGAEGLLAMTAARTVLVRRKGSARHYAPVGKDEVPVFAGLIRLLHGGSAAERGRGLRALMTAGRRRPAGSIEE